MKTWLILAGLGVVAVACVAIVFADRLGGDGPTINGAQKAAAAQLRDPSSAQFRNVRVNQIFVCGEINGKNGFGAYTGFVRFYGTKDSASIDPQSPTPMYQGGPSQSDLFEQSYKAYCS